MPLSLALYQPDIPQNTGTILRLCACMNVSVHIIHPTGFTFSDKIFRRSAMEYADHVDLHEHDSFEHFQAWRLQQSARLVLMSTKSSTSAYDFEYRPDDILMAGRESAGVPDQVAKICNARVRIPMRAQLRSLNVAVSTAMVIGEALRFTAGFADLQ
ncbi:MAG: tRNA (cytidine(34)-2'-O)-methyltransferase [Devosiaceae bacterium]|nr:tRNA (cytidine(34)-2'-O)-methyltransferase [Devosiaceae bacterium]